MAILVCGGAGYIGSHAVAALIEKNEEVVIVDNLVTGHEQAICGGKFYKGDLRDKEFLNKVFNQNKIDAVIHFAAFSLVGESMEEPFKYYNNNVCGTLSLLETMKEYNVQKIVFSSTAATYGEPENIPILEEDLTEPTNAYGETKLAVEKMLKWAEMAYNIKYVVLRYFNVAGAHESGNIGEAHKVESHLIPIILQVALGRREKIMIYGDDYNTKDGSCVRDYIHVMDLVEAHILALEKLRRDNTSATYNLGNGEGFSVKEVIDICRKVTGHAIPSEIAARRSGDPAILIASSEKIIKELGWNPKKASLESIIDSAWKWHRSHPDGY
ncbi:UDP-glucose 4-epimerase GalE [Clostridium botulinum]|uniref:UDP-glucose 4-epimerase n=1 Tax=Clostridium botulinum (strain Hall / ATCC 3502 / NCTC 13319 / Type A) TaxID=441771 RepID=A5I5L3_CLOBH|nr:UDP-glucose 4-epimerase GalE [Clostridium botulinum]ABS34786.1 UDP-glucose 4-epimerase [Clostridium botulinum A str. ATCC 19397]ABS37220.1 UDP-glucose 4-epimerase [Clostridium botulinum A str. Hall]AUM88747.1 UDP-glucose 4-epimerase GalE [Clostridium botulinum]AWB18567.1 UDP-glucose 4-epimerase GalE [Clostridium botulinum]AWB31340.1 UDP-glucose 4-epimerase GalE [Clostridium botulinum]